MTRTVDAPTAAAVAAHEHDGTTGELPSRGWSTPVRLLVGAAVVAGIVQSVIGVTWWIVNLSAVPAYGDTPEYLNLAQELRVDGYRTLAYPVLVRAALEVAERTDVAWQIPVYLGQTLLLVAAVWYAIRTAAPALSRRRVLLATAIVATSPLPLHYAATALSDSIAGSLFLVALAGFARIVVRGDRRPATVALVAAATLGAGLVRSEKSLVMLALAAATVVVLLALRRRRGSAGVPGGRLRALVVAVVLAVVLPALTATVVNRVTQTADYGRPPLSAEAVAMNRIVWPHLAEIRDDLPADARARISPTDAATFDSNNNNVMGMLMLMRDIDDGGDRVILAAIRAALDCCAGAVALDTTKDAAEYAFAPATFLREGVPVLLSEGSEPPFPGRASTTWNITRMNAAHPTLTAAWLAVSWGLLVLLVGAGAATLIRSRRAPARRDGSRRGLVLLTVWLGAVLNGCFFAAAQGADANLRYAITTVLAVMCALVVGILAAGPRGARAGARFDETRVIRPPARPPVPDAAPRSSTAAGSAAVGSAAG